MSDRRIVLAVVVVLGFLAVASLSGIVLLAVLEKPVPDVLQNVGIGSMTAIAALLAKTSSSSEPQTVTIADEPVQVTETPDPPSRKR